MPRPSRGRESPLVLVGPGRANPGRRAFRCRTHGREFAARWGIKVEVESDRSARYLTTSEAAAAAVAGQECEDPACHRVPACVFVERYLLRGEPASTEHPFCREHGGLLAARWRIDIAPVSRGRPG